jgi:hypothetical protein
VRYLTVCFFVSSKNCPKCSPNQPYVQKPFWTLKHLQKKYLQSLKIQIGHALMSTYVMLKLIIINR